MPNYLSPGVYVEELEAGSRPIEGVGTAVAAFIGFADEGPFNQPTLVTNWSQFVNVFGDFTDHGYLHHSIYGFFQNGGGAAYVVRLGADRGGAHGRHRVVRLIRLRGSALSVPGSLVGAQPLHYGVLPILGGERAPRANARPDDRSVSLAVSP